MKGETIVFYLLAALTLVSAAMAVGTRRIFRAAVYLLTSLIGVAGLYFWMRFEFAAAVQIVVYAGGIAVLIIFSVFLTANDRRRGGCPARTGTGHAPARQP